MQHIPVLKTEVITNLAPQSNEHFIDLTLGHGGHASEILKKTAPDGKLLGVEQDLAAINEANKNLAAFADRISIVNANFSEIGLIVRQFPEKNISGILIDLGPNTDQLTSVETGLSFRGNALLDMRLSPKLQTKASDILNKYSASEIAKILFQGEERFARQIAKKIVEYREKNEIKTTDQLVEIIQSAIPTSFRFKNKTHFATGTFRALRMAVNHELENLKSVLPQAASILSPGGRLVIITFHSLEDRIVKHFLRDRADLEVITTKPILADEEEIRINPSARSAKLRVARKI